MAKLYRIKSLKWTNHYPTNPNGETIYCGPNNSGYTKDIYEAGIYTEQEVNRHKEFHGVGETTEVIEVEYELWEKDRIEAWQRYVINDERIINLYKQDIEELKKQIERKQSLVSKTEFGVKRMKQELALQSKLSEVTV